jgi:hypothetical protein
MLDAWFGPVQFARPQHQSARRFDGKPRIIRFFIASE